MSADENVCMLKMEFGVQQIKFFDPIRLFPISPRERKSHAEAYRSGVLLNTIEVERLLAEGTKYFDYIV